MGFNNPRELVRAAGHGLYFQLRQGVLDLDDADIAYQILSAVPDPRIRSSFLSAYAIALALTARYDELSLPVSCSTRRPSVTVLTSPFRTRRACLPWRTPVGGGGVMLRQAALEALSLSRASKDVHSELLSCSVLLRLYVQQSRFAEALGLELGSMRGALKASIGEATCARALAFACAGRTAEARELVDGVRDTTTAVEPVVLVSAVDATCALRDGSNDVVDRAVALESVSVRDWGGRSARNGLSVLSGTPLDPSSLRAGPSISGACGASGGRDLATAVGQPIAFKESGAPVASGEGGIRAPPRRTNESPDRKAPLHRGIHCQGAHSSHIRQARRPLAERASRTGGA